MILLCPVFVSGQASHPDFKREVISNPIPKSIAFHKGISIDNGLANWNGKPHLKCTVEWSILGSHGGTTLYRARYSWPNEDIEELKYRNYHFVTEILFEGTRKGKSVTPIFSTTTDETVEFLEPLRFHQVNNISIIEIPTCLNGTGGCGQEFLSWKPGDLRKMSARIRQDIDKWLPAGYETWKGPSLNIDKLAGFSGAWRNGDGNCCPSKFVNFQLSITPDEIKIHHLTLDAEPHNSQGTEAKE